MNRLKNTGRLAGKTIFITGASRGIGLAFAKKFAQDGSVDKNNNPKLQLLYFLDSVQNFN